MKFKPRKTKAQAIAERAAAKADRPLYAGKTVKERLNHYSDTPLKVSLPLIKWVEK